MELLELLELLVALCHSIMNIMNNNKAALESFGFLASLIKFELIVSSDVHIACQKSCTPAVPTLYVKFSAIVPDGTAAAKKVLEL